MPISIINLHHNEISKSRTPINRLSDATRKLASNIFYLDPIFFRNACCQQILLKSIDKNISEVLEMTVAEALQRRHERIPGRKRSELGRTGKPLGAPTHVYKKAAVED